MFRLSFSTDRHTFSQIVKISIGLFILAIILVIYIPKLFFTYSINAVVSAKIMRIGSPIDGVLTKAPPPIGTELRKDEIIGKVENPTLDKSTLEELKTEQKSLTANIKAMQEEKNILEKMKQRLQENQNLYKENKIKRLLIDISRYEIKHQELLDSVKQNSIRLNRQEILKNEGIVSQSRVETAFLSKDRAIKAALQVKIEIDRLKSELEAVKNNVYINTDGQSEVMYQEQRMDDIIIRQSDIDSKIRKDTGKLEFVTKRLALEEKRIEQLSSAIVKAPGYSVIWRSQLAEGGYIGAKTPIVDLIDCTKVFIEMTVDERYFDNIKPGDKVKIKLIGSNKKIKGYVSNIRGGALAREIAHSSAGATPVRRDRESQVFINLEEKELEKSTGDFCHVGRNASVVFKGKGAGFLGLLKHII